MRVHALTMGTRIGTAREVGLAPSEVLNQSCKREGSSEGATVWRWRQGAGDLAGVNLAWQHPRV